MRDRSEHRDGITCCPEPTPDSLLPILPTRDAHRAPIRLLRPLLPLGCKRLRPMDTILAAKVTEI